MKEAIRLTNKTAISLRKSAQSVRRAYVFAEVIVSLVLGIAGVLLGFKWLWAVPVMIAVIALIDCALMVSSRSHYLSLLGQAICTEAAARELHAKKSEMARREQLVGDLLRIKEDVKQPGKQGPDAQPFFEKKNEEAQEEEDDDLLPPPAKPKAEAAPQRRRRQGRLELIRSETAK